MLSQIAAGLVVTGIGGVFYLAIRDPKYVLDHFGPANFAVTLLFVGAGIYAGAYRGGFRDGIANARDGIEPILTDGAELSVLAVLLGFQALAMAVWLIAYSRSK